MPRGPRRGATSERRIARKVKRTLQATHGGYAGASLIEMLETELLEAMITYLRAKDAVASGIERYEGELEKQLLKRATARGVVGGLSQSVALMRNAYTADDPQVIKALEREFVKLARTQTVA